MKGIATRMTILFFSGWFLVSCVPNRKYTEEVAARQTAQTEAANEKQKRKEADEARAAAETKIEELEEDYSELKSDHTLLDERYKKQQELNKDLQASYDKLLELQEKMERDARERKNEIAGELAEKKEELDRKERELRRREDDMRDLEERLKEERAAIDKLKLDLEGKDANINSLEEYKAALEKDLLEREKRVKDLESSLSEREKRVKELEDIIAARDAKAKALQDKLNAALLGFEASDLKIERRDGKIYISMSQNLLFSSGSSKLDSKGADAIKKVAEVLQKNSDINVLVEGHTDSDGDAKMNWELSTQRSLTITHEFIGNGMQPERITAAGRGEHFPVASNDTEEGKAKNRRTEIIISPKLDAVYDMLKD